MPHTLNDRLQGFDLDAPPPNAGITSHTISPGEYPRGEQPLPKNVQQKFGEILFQVLEKADKKTLQKMFRRSLGERLPYNFGKTGDTAMGFFNKATAKQLRTYLFRDLFLKAPARHI
jgi:hypothetical protein